MQIGEMKSHVSFRRDETQDNNVLARDGTIWLS